ncbi:MAG TPA: 2-phosphosulfolactate phosphatase [Dermatophilaceae bacterium]|nr:2-phosphosulfolactate phosphatase [Dermatophilaceae bacterium]
MGSPWGQGRYAVRVDWGARGAAELVGDGVVAVVVVDVLSFSTAVSVAVERGIAVRPHDGPPGSAEVVAAMEGATCAVGRSAAREVGGVSLSPASIAAAEGVSRLVLPSPNGSAISARLAEAGVAVAAGCLRNSAAVARWLGGVDGPVGLVAAGERWEDGSMRPAAEDQVGVGAVLEGLAALGAGRTASPEATAAWAAFKGARVQWPGWLHGCASGVELVEQGFGGDVVLAAEVDATAVVPVLKDGEFVGRPHRPGGASGRS